MRRSFTAMLVLVFLATSCVAVKPALSSADVAEDTWVQKAPMHEARVGLGVVEMDGKIYAIGGAISNAFASDLVGTNEEYDPATDTWTYKTACRLQENISP